MAASLILESQRVILVDTVNRAVQRLVSARADGDGVSISLPITYPNGNMAAVHISQNKDVYFVSDQGLGHLEAEYSGADDYFDGQAKKAAEEFGVSYDGYSLFALKVSLGRIDGAVIAVANASVRAAAAAIYRSLEAKSRYTNDEVFVRLVDFFGAASVTKKATIDGARDAWDVHNIVKPENGRSSVFEFVASHQASIASKFYMFSDLRDSANHLTLCSVVENLTDFNKVKSRQLADISNVIAFNAKKETFVRFANLEKAA
jgi:hypothetical protein